MSQSVLPLRTANKPWLIGSYEHDRQIVLFLSAAGTLSHVSDVGIERVSLCVGKLELRILARRVKVPLVSSYSGGKNLHTK